jgi:integrase
LEETARQARELSALPAAPETVALYVTDLAANRGLKASTIRRRLASISQLHKEAGYPSPAAHEHVKDVLKGILRRHGSLQEGADPILIGTVRRMLGPMEREEGSAADRDRALLLLGLAGGLRRSELSASTQAWRVS